MYGDWFYTTDYAIFGHGVKATRKGIEKISRSLRAYAYLVQGQA